MRIERNLLLEAIRNFASRGHGILLGPPGVGKTYLLCQVVEDAIGQGNRRALYLPIDKLGIDDEASLRMVLDMKTDLVSHLQNDLGRSELDQGLIVIDGFDAARSERSRAFWLGVIRRILSRLEHKWALVVGVRTYDGRRSLDLRDLFRAQAGEAIAPEYQSPGVDCRHLTVPPLTDSEVANAMNSSRHLEGRYEQCSGDLKELLRIPFNLWLLDTIAESGFDLGQIGSVASEVHLLEKFFEYRVTSGPGGQEREILLARITKRMAEALSLSLGKADACGPQEGIILSDLLSQEVLTEPTGYRPMRVAFSHNILFDYAVALLVIEGRSSGLIDFLSSEPARTLFLRPSLDYFLTRYWYLSRDSFWDCFWHLLSHQGLPLSLVGKIVPATIVAREAAAVEDFEPIAAAAEAGRQEGILAILYLLRAWRVLKIGMDEVRLPFLARVSVKPHATFVPALSMATSEILDRAAARRGDKPIGSCGQISRRLFRWYLARRDRKEEPGFDGVAAIWMVPLIAKTYGSSPGESRELLAKVLEMTSEEEFPIRMLFSLADNIDSIWSHDPQFVRQIYSRVFLHAETSEEKTDFGGYVLPLSSTRRQDYQMCQYILMKKTIRFLRAAPLVAAEAVIRAVDVLILQEHVLDRPNREVSLQDITERFPFRGKMATYIHDCSFVWDQPGPDSDPIQMANSLFEYLGTLAEAGSQAREVDDLMNLFADCARTAFFWKRLLAVGTRAPEAFAQRLADLCVAKPIQTGSETLYELGEFLREGLPKMHKEQVLKTEISLLEIPVGATDPDKLKRLEQIRDRLFAQFPRELLATSKGRKIRESIDATERAPSNEPLVSFSGLEMSYMEMPPEAETLRRRGVDIDRTENREIAKLLAPLRDFTSTWQNDKPAEAELAEIQPVVSMAFRLASAGKDIDTTLLDSAWEALSACAEAMSHGTEDPDSPVFSLCRQILLDSSKHKQPELHGDDDITFDHPGWSPAPRNSAAEGLPWLAAQQVDTEILRAISALAVDEVPSVRYLVARSLFRLKERASDTFWSIAKLMAGGDPNSVVLTGLCRSLSYVLLRDETESVQALRLLEERALGASSNQEIMDSFIALVVALALIRDNPWATDTLNSIFANPDGRARQIRRIAHHTLAYLTAERLENLKTRESTERAVSYARRIVRVASESVRKIGGRGGASEEDRQTERLREAYEIIHDIVSELHFSIRGKERQQSKEVSLSRQSNMARYCRAIKPLLDDILDFGSNREYGLMFAPTAHHLMEILNSMLDMDPPSVVCMAAEVAKSSADYGYNLDQLAVREVVKLVEAVLADYRSHFKGGKPLEALVDLLDVFADAGWEEALSLVWRLDEIFR